MPSLLGARIGATSSLRIRLIDQVREDAQEHRRFQSRVVAAVNELGISTAHVIAARIVRLEQMRDKAKAEYEATGSFEPMETTLKEVTPEQDHRVVAATEQWRSVLAESHADGSNGTIKAMEWIDAMRAETVQQVDKALQLHNIDDTIRGLQAAQKICMEMRSEYAQQVYRELQVESRSAVARVFQLAHLRRLRRFSKKVAQEHARSIDDARSRIADTNQTLEARRKATGFRRSE